MSDWRVATVAVLVLLLVVPVWALARLCTRSGRPAWLALLALCPPFGIVLLWILAFAAWREPRAGGLRRELLVFAVPTALVLGVWFLWLRHAWIYEPGLPTSIPRGASPAAAVCEIRAEFEALKRPVLKRMVHYEAWTEHRFAAGTFHWQGFSRPELNDEARRFVARHSHLEIVSAVAPLVLDEELGGEAAVLLAGLPLPRKSSAPGAIGPLGRLITDSDYRGPEHRGRWSAEVARQAQRQLSPLHGIEFSLDYSSRTRELQRSGTLDREIAQALEIFTIRVGKPDQVVEDDGRFTDRESALGEWLDQEPPRAIASFQEELDRYPQDFLALVAFPLGGVALSHSYYTQRFVWMMNLQRDYWPLVGDRLDTKERESRAAALLADAAEQALDVCSREHEREGSLPRSRNRSTSRIGEAGHPVPARVGGDSESHPTRAWSWLKEKERPRGRPSVRRVRRSRRRDDRTP